MTRRVYAPASGLATWRSMLADPERQWVRGASAFETAVFWERGAGNRRGLTPELAALLDKSPAWHDSTVLGAFPEHRVALPGGSRASQNDVWALLKGPTGLLSLAVEGKAGEPFGETVEEWTKDASDGKAERLEHLAGWLGLKTPVDGQLRYQLLHRTASALIEARRTSAVSAGVVVLSFRDDPKSKDDFAHFCKALGVTFQVGEPLWAQNVRSSPLFLAWLDLPPASDAEVAAATV